LPSFAKITLQGWEVITPIVWASLQRKYVLPILLRTEIHPNKKSQHKTVKNFRLCVLLLISCCCPE
jgi:hypothetical protein